MSNKRPRSDWKKWDYLKCRNCDFETRNTKFRYCPYCQLDLQGYKDSQVIV